MKTFYTIEYCQKVRLDAWLLRMDACPSYFAASSQKLAEVMNGCGPDSWTDGMRNAASWVYRNFPENISIHDWDFEQSDGNLETLKIVNQRFWDNGKKKLDKLYPLGKFWLAPIRAWAWSKLQFGFFALRNGSEEAWISAHRRLNPPELT
jgi:hypothetical protein